MQRASRASVIGVVAAIVAVTVATGSTEIPLLISYQGKVTDASGVPVPDNTYSMRFRIYNVATGGSSLWDSGTRSIAVAGGVFSVLLGESPQPALDLAFDEDYWMLVTFSGVDQTPRQRLASTGYAYMASGLVPGTQVNGTINGGAMLKAQNQGTTGWVYGGVFDAAGTSTTAAGVLGRNFHTAGTDNYGGFFISWSPSGAGVKGQAVATTGSCYGVLGMTDSPSGRGVYGIATATTGTCYGGYFETASASGTGVRGVATATTGVTYGVYGRSYSTTDDSRGVYGRSYATVGGTYGVYGQSDSQQGTGVRGECPFIGVYGEGTAGSNVTYGVFALSHSPSGRALYAENTSTGWAGYFLGDVNINGSLTVSESFFPIPAYDSGWQSGTVGGNVTLTHSLGGSVNNYVVDIQHNVSGLGVTNRFAGGDDDGSDSWGFFWHSLTTTSIQVHKGSEMNSGEQFRIRIWRY